jgi:hypothetical protein
MISSVIAETTASSHPARARREPAVCTMVLSTTTVIGVNGGELMI